MKKLRTVLIVLVVLIFGLGFYRGWFVLSNPAPGVGSNIVNINLAADPDKMKGDAEIVRHQATELTGGVTDDVKADGQANDIVKSNDH